MSLINFKYLTLFIQLHRVVIPEENYVRNKGRHSIAYFVHPDNLTPIIPMDKQTPSTSCEELCIGGKPKQRKKSFKAAKLK